MRRIRFRRSLQALGLVAASIVPAAIAAEPAQAADVQCTMPYYLASNYSVNSTCSGTGNALIVGRCYKLAWWVFGPEAVVRQATPSVNGTNVTVSVGCGFGRGPRSNSDMWVQGY